MSAFTANSDYEEKDSHPIRLQPGDRIRTGRADQTWPGWVWATDSHGNDGYVPAEILQAAENGRFSVTEAFDPTVLTIRRGDRLTSLRQIHGWHWCRNDAGSEGWVAGYLLRPVA
jgi:Variant SH3 domain